MLVRSIDDIALLESIDDISKLVCVNSSNKDPDHSHIHVSHQKYRLDKKHAASQRYTNVCAYARLGHNPMVVSNNER